MTKEGILAKARIAKSAQELITMAKDNGLVLNLKEAQEAFERAHSSKKLSPDALSKVAGGFVDSGDPDKDKGNPATHVSVECGIDL